MEPLYTINSAIRKQASLPMAAILLSLIFLWSTEIYAQESESPHVQTASGPITGKVVGENRSVYAFLGIPYAAPPTGLHRWQPPQPVTPWKETRACHAFGPTCPQPPSAFGLIPETTDEDCLYLNVWTPTIKPKKGQPVMVWIHGGGHTTGAGSLPLYDGTELARHGVVVVTINYRLGPLGYFAHPALSEERKENVSGNYGLLDQIAALHWLRENISAFGGAPNNITAFGESAGAQSIALLMVSPLAKGLFQKAILQSGGPIGNFPYLKRATQRQPSAEARGEILTKTLLTESKNNPLTALRALSPTTLIETLKPNATSFGNGTHFGPVIDGYVLPADPALLWKEGEAMEIPILCGANADDGSIFAHKIPVHRPIGYRIFLRSRYGVEEGERVFGAFPAHASASIPSALSDLLTVNGFAMPARFMVTEQAQTPVASFLYHFTHKPDTKRVKQFGAFHGLEIPYVFGNLSPALVEQEEDAKLSELMLMHWVQFAATNNPAIPGLSDWPAFEPKAKTCKFFEKEPTINIAPLGKACDTMERLMIKEKMRDAEEKDPGETVGVISASSPPSFVAIR